jgi:3-oxoacyl-[acyl-carrier-protein] synthase II
MAEREVVITGMGAVTPLGRDVASTWDALVAGRRGIDHIGAFDAGGYPCRIAAEVRDYTPHASIPAERAARLDRTALFAIDAALQAVDDAGLAITLPSAPHVAVVLGCARPGETSVWMGQRAFNERGAQALRGGYIGRTLANMPAALVAGAVGSAGQTLAVAAGGASGDAAIALAASLVRSGQAEAVLAGGADAAVTPPALAAFAAMEILSSRNDDPPGACRPFDQSADGMVLGEGAGFLVLENDQLARERGARVYARLSGAASVTEPGAAGAGAADAGRAIQAALRQPALLQSEIDYLCAYGCGMLGMDQTEVDAVKRVFGAAAAAKLTMSAPKSMVGHMLGASGALSAVVCVKAIESGVIPPTINLEQPIDPDLDFTPSEARPQPVRNALTYAYGFGGHHVALCFSAP